ncbi:MAG: hypothetical protein FJZ80_07775 [Bacteroidetes bacterium]|nr:hypothetical protein [Bacteroidota bacterium]
MTPKNRILTAFKWALAGALLLIVGLSLSLYVFQDRICNAVLNEVGKQFKEPVYFKNADLAFWATFPNLAVNINEVRINDAFPNPKKQGKLLSAKRIRLIFNPWDLWNENYHIKVVELKKGELNLRISKNGATNYHIFRPSPNANSSPLTVKISSFRTLDFKVNYLNAADNQIAKTTLQEMTFSGAMNNLNFALMARGDFNLNEIQSGSVVMIRNKPVKVNLSLDIDASQGRIQFPTSKVLIAGIPLNLGGIYSPDSMNILLSAFSLPLTDVVNKLSLESAQKEVQTYKGRGTVDFRLRLSSNPSHPKTAIDCRFEVNKGHLQEPIKHTHITGLSMKGSYTSNGEPEKDQIRLSNLKFKSVAGLFKANLTIHNFINPNLKGSAHGALDLEIVNKLFKNDYLNQVTGLAKLKADFDLDLARNVRVHRVNGTLQLNNVGFKALNDHRTFERINGIFTLRGSEVGIEGATLSINRSDVALDGRFGNVYNYLSNSGNLQVDCKLESQNLFVEDLGKTTREEKRENVGKQFVLPKNIDGIIALKAQHISYENHSFYQLGGNISLGEGVLNFPSLSFRNGGADILGSVNIREDAPEHLLISAKLHSGNIHFAPFFREWNNFDQEVITAQQISGIAQTELDFFAPFDLIGGIELHEIKVNARIKVLNGSLRNVKALEEVASSLKTNTGKLLIGKKNLENFERNLNNIAFRTLENTLVIERGVLTIPNMRIESSAMNLELSGTHSFEQQIDYRIKFDFRELLGEDRDAEFGLVMDDGTGPKIYLRMYGHLDDPVIEWDKFSKKQDLKEQLVQEKETIKSILKTEFGVFKNDSTVKEIKETKETKEVVRVNFHSPKVENKAEKTKAVTPAPKENKLKSKLNQWKTEQNQSNVSVVVKKG